LRGLGDAVEEPEGLLSLAAFDEAYAVGVILVDGRQRDGIVLEVHVVVGERHSGLQLLIARSDGRTDLETKRVGALGELDGHAVGAGHADLLSVHPHGRPSRLGVEPHPGVVALRQQGGEHAGALVGPHLHVGLLPGPEPLLRHAHGVESRSDILDQQGLPALPSRLSVEGHLGADGFVITSNEPSLARAAPIPPCGRHGPRPRRGPPP